MTGKIFRMEVTGERALHGDEMETIWCMDL